MKKIFIFALIFILTLSLLTACSGNKDNNGNDTSAPTGAGSNTSVDGRLTLDKTTYRQGEQIVISYSGVEIDDSKGRTTICVARPQQGAADFISGWREFLTESSGTITKIISENMEEGAYEVRLYRGSDPKNADFIWYKEATVEFTVSK